MTIPHQSLAALGVAIALTACHGDKSTAPSGVNTPCAAANVISLGPLEGVTLPADSANCLEMAPGTGSYVIVPQFAVEAPDSNFVPFEVGALSPASADLSPAFALMDASVGVAALSAGGPHGALPAAFDHQRRVRARTLAASLAGKGAARAAVAASRLAPVSTLPGLGSTRIFQVCAAMTCNVLKPDTAILKFVGTNIMLYQSQDAVPAPNGFTDGEITAFGNVFDQTLYPIDVNAFGAPSDIDGNGRVIVLITPKVNALTPKASCATQGYVAGFFFEADLIPSFQGSNGGELYYSLAPDPAGLVSCAHTKAEVQDANGSIFLHETLHMINFGVKVLIHGLLDTEAEFLDEGMAKIAEELGSKHYEALFPPPTGRTNPLQIFPDSAEGFISGDIYDSYAYLLSPKNVSATTTIPGGSTLAGAGAEWLFLRWLGDQRGDAIFGQLVQSSLTGVANIEAQSSARFASLFAQAGLAAYTDSIPGLARDQVPAVYQLSSRNIRQLNAAIYRANGGPTAQFPRPFALLLQPLSADVSLQGRMLKGTSAYFTYSAPSSGAAERLHFRQPGGGAFATTLRAQVTVFRCPMGVTCQ